MSTILDCFLCYLRRQDLKWNGLMYLVARSVMRSRDACQSLQSMDGHVDMTPGPIVRMLSWDGHAKNLHGKDTLSMKNKYMGIY
mmetsp:Transcript_19959/g.23852  ORF Transcript_19959/g.23852 Transcript_19959/m.23852 type:complete len:84 (+) Transcript_19959:728-979(+)